MVNLADRVGSLEGSQQKFQEQMEGMQIGMEKLQIELQQVQNIEKNMAIISEQFTFMRARWEEAERERKRKGQAGAKDLEYTGQPEASPDMGMNGKEGGFAISGGWNTEIKGRRLEMPVFTGNNPDEWIYKAERYFTVNHLTELEKLETAGLCFKEGALSWYQWEQKRRDVRNWEMLKETPASSLQIGTGGHHRGTIPGPPTRGFGDELQALIRDTSSSDR